MTDGIRRAMTGWVCGGVAALSVGGLLLAPRLGDARVDRGGCGDSLPLAGLEQQWGGTGAWKRLAPYPVPREASPTDSIGVWLERWSLPDGSAALRRVSATQTIIAHADDGTCLSGMDTVRRTYAAASMAEGFTDDSLRALVWRSRAGMVYVWSPGMPLSVTGLAEARAAAQQMGLAFTAVVADASSEAVRVAAAAHGIASQDTRPMESFELVYRDATVHYPAVVLYRDGVMLDGVIPGYKSRDTYRAMARELMDGRSSVVERANVAAPAMWVDHRARVVVKSSVPTPREIGFFFKPVGTTSLVSYTSGPRAYLFDVVTRKETRIPGHVDPVPTPDGRFLTLPGLSVRPIPSLVRGDTSAIFVDRQLPDEYQTASILREARGTVRYRVVTGWRDNARFRDYDVTLATARKPAKFTAVAAPFVPCTGRTLTLPISAKSGREFGALDVKRNTNGVFEVREDGSCIDKLDLGFVSGKLSFSYDGTSVAFATSRVNVDAAGTLLKPSENFYKDALVLQRATGRIVSITRNKPLRRMSFPEFLPDGNVMVLDQHVAGQAYGVLRVVEVR